MSERSPRATISRAPVTPVTRAALSRALRGCLAAATAGVVLAAGQPAATAAEEPAYPSQSDVEDARERVHDTERSVGAIRSDLASANAELEDRAIEAAQASEAYNGAVWELQSARKSAKRAQRRAHRQDRQLDKQRRDIGGLVAQTYQGGSSFGQMSAYLTSEDADRLLDRVTAFRGASQSLLNSFDKLAAQRTLAEVYRDQAKQAEQAADDAAVEAEQAKQTATDAVNSQERAVAAIDQRRGTLLQELAEAQDISVELATERQEALEQIEQERKARAAEERVRAERRREAREEAALQEQREVQAVAQQEAQQEAQEEAQHEERRSAENEGEQRAQRRTDRQVDQGEQQRQAAASERRAREREARQRRAREQEARERREREQQARERRQREQERENSSPPPSSGGAEAAIDFAEAQLGERYVWGGAGPNSWDCSGLTMKAWSAGGRGLPHNSGMQYHASSPISYGQLRRGDLIFWSSNGSSSGIYHVALYIGGDRMIHAPNSNSVVKVDNIWYMGTPSHYGRV